MKFRLLNAMFFIPWFMTVSSCRKALYSQSTAKIPSAWLLSFFTCFLLSGCAATTLDVSLQGDLSAGTYEPVPATIGVDVFVDQRPQCMGNDGKTWLGLIPGMCWLEIDTDLPEIYTAYSHFKSRPLQVSFSRAITASLVKSRFARKVVYLPTDPYEDIDYRIEGTLLKSNIKETGYYYGSAIYVWILRVLGLPYVSYELSLEAELKVRDMASNKIIWQGKVEGERSDNYLNVYQIASGKDGKHLIAYHFADILTNALNRLIPEMHKTILQLESNRNGKRL